MALYAAHYYYFEGPRWMFFAALAFCAYLLVETARRAARRAPQRAPGR